MIGKILKKLFGSKKTSKVAAETKFAASIKEKSAKLSQFFNERLKLLQNEFFLIKKKCQNLSETNYQLGLKHLEKGNLRDAIFRFRFVKKFWPEIFDAHYQLAYCLVLNKKPLAAKKVLEELLDKKPDFDQKAKMLLNRLNAAFERSLDDA